MNFKIIIPFIILASTSLLTAWIIVKPKSKRKIARVKITLQPSIDFIPYIGAQNACMIEFFFICFRFDIYYPLK